MEKNKCNKVFLVIWMSLIFALSSMDNSSQITKKYATEIVYELELFDNLEIDEKELIEWLNFMLRKGAHVTEFCILAIVLNKVFTSLGYDEKKAWMLAIFLSVGYALTDEFHQMFVDNRTSTLKDVLYDAYGALIGASGDILLKKLRKDNK